MALETKSTRRSRGGRKIGDTRDGASTAGGERPVPFLLVCLRDGGCYEHQLEARLDSLGVGGLRSGELRRVLWGMEREGLLRCDREGGGYRVPRRWYEISEAGEALLRLQEKAPSLRSHYRRRERGRG